MKKRFFRKGLTLFASMLLVIASLGFVVEAKPTTGGTTTPTTTTKPIFGSSFIQYWFCQDWDQVRWTQELSMLQNAGINEIILQDIVDTTPTAKYATYPTTLSEYTHNDVDMLANVLNAADNLGMKVRIGLGFNDDWWNKNASDLTWLTDEATVNKAIVDEVVTKYGNHASLGGWYIPYEFSQLTARTTTQQSYLNNFFKQIATEITLTSPGKNIMVAPFYNSQYSWMVSLSSWTTMLQNILKDTGVNIVALQDSVGAGYNTLSQLSNLYTYTKKSTDALGMKLYADTETFTHTSSGNVPAKQSRISSQLSYEKAYVQGFVAFSIDHFQNKNVETQVSNYNDYYKYYLSNK